MLPIMVAAGAVFRTLQLETHSFLGGGLLAIGTILTSTHHLYTIWGPSNVMAYTAQVLTGCIFLALGIALQARKKSAGTFNGKKAP